jgi:rhamnose utilization protein RhaD (predicted bifunctional aldolase and dehydrogenase)
LNSSDVLGQLVEMSRALGVPERDFVILGEGNTSARSGEMRCWIKASGFPLDGIDQGGFVEIDLEPVLELLKPGGSDAADISQRLLESRVDRSTSLRPSVEAGMHAVIYALCGANFIAHTHPTAVDAVVCSKNAHEVLEGRLFPDHIVFCGARPAFVSYVEFGLPLARLVKQTLEEHLDAYGEAPKTIFLQNHGLIALGKTAGEVESITAMSVKSCRVLIGTAAFGGPRFLSEEEVSRIHTHPSELYRRKLAGF